MSLRPSFQLGIVATLSLLALPSVAVAQRNRPTPSVAPAPPPDVNLLNGLAWRNVGPFRGGRATTITGVPGQPLVYYMGATGGGIWKTDDAGANWRPIADGQLKMGSVGALALAPDDPNVLYAGMGEAPVRGVSSSWGNGIYKTTDAGKTWNHLPGLRESRTIARVIVHPKNSDLVYVAVQGSRWGPSRDRGVHRSLDGGKTWKLLLTGDSLTGPSELTMDPTNPRVLYASMWDHQRLPWHVRSGGPGSGIWKTTDGGDTWTRLAKGLPGLMGKIGVAVSATLPSRVWAIVEAEQGGLYRSDDGGDSWRLVNSDRVLHARPWYYMRVTADPTNADVVYVINAPVMKSIDGGKSFTTLPDVHGDNHDLWINPANPMNLAKADDGGAAISFTGGVTWSSIMNQPTAQFYRVSVDNQYPYWLYSGQQDNSSVAMPNAVMGPGIGNEEFHSAGGCESAHVAFDVANPRYLYGNCYGGIISEYDRVLKTDRNVMAYPYLGLAEPSNLTKYRWNWSSPIVTSSHDRKVIYHGSNVVFRSADRGQSWVAISPDLTRNDRTKQGAGGGPITNEGAGGEVYGALYYLAESPHDASVLWAGTDDGLVQVTRDGGTTWNNVTPKGLPESLINMIEVSTFDPATAFMAVSRHKWNDNTPHVFKTTDYGASWTRLVTGFQDGDPVRVVREDPTVRNLLYAGTETGFFVSYDGGLAWQRLQLNLPHVPVTDIRVHQDDLVIATEGRAFWILDDIAPIRNLIAAGGTTGLTLFQPRTTVRTELGSNGTVPGMGKNAPQGALISFWAPTLDTATIAKLEILDAQNAVVRTFATDAKPAEGGKLTLKSGFNRVIWDLRREPPTRLAGVFGAEAGTAATGYRVAPGRYQARLTIGKEIAAKSVDVVADPRTNPSPADIRGQQEALARAYERIDEIHRRIITLRSIRDQVKALTDRTTGQPDGDSVATAGRALTAAIDSVEGVMINARARTFQDVINFRNGLNDQYLNLVAAIDGTDAPVTVGMRTRFDDLEKEWAPIAARVRQIIGGDVERFNATIRARNVPAVIVPKNREPIP